MNNDLIPLLLDAGLLQFGRFITKHGIIPLRTHLEMLASYPDVLAVVVERAATEISGLQVDRMLCGPSALPLGTALSMKTGIPLVYSRGSHAPAVNDLVGAYDIGHPTLVLANSLDAGDELALLVQKARHVGLETHTALVVLDTGHSIALQDVELRVLLRLEAVVSELAGSGRLPAGHAQQMRMWLDANRLRQD